MAKTPAAIVVDGQDPNNENKRQAINATGQAAIQNQPNMDVALSTRALEAGGNLAAIKAKADNIDVALSTRALETGGNLAAIKAKTDNLDVALSTRALAATQSDGTQKAIARGGAKGTTVAADITSSNINADCQALDVHNWGLGTGNSQQVEGLAAEGVAHTGNPVWIGGHDGAFIRAMRMVLDDTIYRLMADAKVAKGNSALVHLDALDTLTGRGRLKATLFTPDGDAVSFGATPPNPSSIRNAFVKNASVESLLVDGSATPIVYTYDADVVSDISIQELKFVLVANSVAFGSSAFGAVAGPLANGLLVEIVAGGNTGTIYNLLQNESFVNFASPGGFEWVVSSKDMMSSTYLIGGGLKLIHNTTDKIRVTVRDNLTAAGVYFKCFVKGNLLPVV